MSLSMKRRDTTLTPPRRLASPVASQIPFGSLTPYHQGRALAPRTTFVLSLLWFLQEISVQFCTGVLHSNIQTWAVECHFSFGKVKGKGGSRKQEGIYEWIDHLQNYRS